MIFAILAGGAPGGPLGLFIAIPFAAVARLLLRYLYDKLIDERDPSIHLSPSHYNPTPAQLEVVPIKQAPEPLAGAPVAGPVDQTEESATPAN